MLKPPFDAATLSEQYKGIASHEQHFNGLQAGLRQLASAWLLAALGAIAWLVKSKVDGSMLDPRLLIAIVAAMGNLGLLVTWILDQVVYHRLLNAAFLLGLRLEYLNRQLPPIRTLMMLYSRKRGMSRFLRLFYLLPMGVLATVAVSACLWTLDGQADLPPLKWVFGLGACLLPAWVMWRARTLEGHAEIAKGFGDPDFERMLVEQNYESILKGH